MNCARKLITFPTMPFRAYLTSVLLAIVVCACGKSQPETPAVASANSTGASAARAGNNKAPSVVTKSGVEMVALPGGEFTMGSAHGNPDESPPHTVSVSAFLIDKFEVTHAM